MDFISALKTAQIRSLVNSGDLQLSLFDQVNLAEISSPLFPASGSSCAATRPSPPNAPANAQSCSPRPRPSSTRSKRASPAPAAACAPPTPADRRARRARDQQVQGRQALHPADRRRRLRLRAQQRPDHQRGRPGRPLRDPHHPPRTPGSARPPRSAPTSSSRWPSARSER